MSRFDKIEQSDIIKLIKKYIGLIPPGGGGGATVAAGTAISVVESPATVFTVSAVNAALDHGTLGGLADDDHAQYHNNTRGDARYPLIAHTHVKANITDFAHTHVKADVTDFAHVHAGADITSGTVAYARLPVGTTASTVAIGDHTHVKANITDFAHTHPLSDLTQSSAVTYDSPQWNGSAWASRDIHASTNRIVMKCELNTLGQFTAIGTGTGASNSFLTAGYAFDGRVGFLLSGTGTTATGVAGVGTALTDQIVLGTYATSVCDIVRLPALSTALARFAVDCGLTDNRTGGVTAPVDGVYFQYSDNVNTGKWLCCCMNNNSLTTGDSGITVAANTWYNLRIEINTTQALFYIDGALVATVGGIPTGTARVVGKSALIRKSVGIVTSTIIIDYTHFIQGTTR